MEKHEKLVKKGAKKPQNKEKQVKFERIGLVIFCVKIRKEDRLFVFWIQKNKVYKRLEEM